MRKSVNYAEPKLNTFVICIVTPLAEDYANDGPVVNRKMRKPR